MKSCKKCGYRLESGDKFCHHCGRKQKKGSSGFPWRRIVMVILFLFLVTSSAYMVYERVILAAPEDKNVDVVPEERDLFSPDLMTEEDDPLLGSIYGREEIDSWNYPGGVLEEHRAKDKDGNRLTIFRDGGSGETIGFTVVEPHAVRVTVSEQEALEIAGEMAAQASFYNDPTLQLTDSGLVSNFTIENEPDSGSEYYFKWQAIDQSSGALLLRAIEVVVHAETGQVIHYGAHDFGEVEIVTRPEIEEGEAVQLALERASRTFSQPGVIDTALYVSGDGSGQKLLWSVAVEETDSSEMAQALWVTIDAVTGRVLDVSR